MAFATSTVIAAAGIATSATGLLKSNQASRRAASATAQRAANANEIQSLTAEASVEQARITREQEQLRREEARSNFVRARRNAIRQAQIARARSVNSAANVGGLQSSSAAGGQAQITSSLGSNLTALNESFERGEQNFELNEDLVETQTALNVATGRINQQQASLSSTIANAQASQQLGNSLFTIGSQFTANSKEAGRVIDTLFD